MRRWLCSLVFLLFLLIAFPPGPSAMTLVLEWDAPTLNDDGSLLTDLADYVVCHDNATIPDDKGTADCSTVIAAVPGQVHVVTAGILCRPGTVCFVRASARDASGNESVLSNEASAEVMPPAPLTIIIRSAVP